MSRKLHTGLHCYELDLRDINLMPAAHAQTIWIVKIEDESGHYITSCRIAGEQDEVHKIANMWLNSLCARNPGKLLATNITAFVSRDHDK